MPRSGSTTRFMASRPRRHRSRRCRRSPTRCTASRPSRLRFRPRPAAPAPAAVAPLASLLIRGGALKGKRLPVRAPVVNIGRADYNDIVLPEASVSTAHAKLQRREGVWVMSDLDSTNGTTVDGEPVKGEFPLSPGATIRFGEVAVLFEPMDARPMSTRLGHPGHAAHRCAVTRRRSRPPPRFRAAAADATASRSPRPASKPRTVVSSPPKKILGLDMGARPVPHPRRGGRRAGLPEVASVRFTCAARTDVGIVRSGNEDNYLMLSDRGLFIVADGMGGHAAGEVASEMAVRLIAREVGCLKGLDNSGASNRLAQAIRHRQRRHLLADPGRARQARHGHHRHRAWCCCRGATSSARSATAAPTCCANGALLQLTKDHSYVQEQVDAGLLTPEQARVHPVRQRDHPLCRRQHRRGARHLLRSPAARRRGPARLRRPDRHAGRRAARAHPARRAAAPSAGSTG